MKKSLLALVATAVMVGGERKVIQPGQPLPELPEQDADELVAARAARPAEALVETAAPDAAASDAAGPAAAGTDTEPAEPPQAAAKLAAKPAPKKGAAKA